MLRVKEFIQPLVAPLTKFAAKANPAALVDMFEGKGPDAMAPANVIPRFPPFTAEEKEYMESPGGDAIIDHGHGVLDGQIMLLQKDYVWKTQAQNPTEVPVLVTSHRGLISEYGYELDLSPNEAKKLLGKQVQIEADFTKRAPDSRFGVAAGSSVLQVTSSPDVQHDSIAQIAGIVRINYPFDRAQPPYPRRVDLDKPLFIDGKMVDSVALTDGEALTEGQHIAFESKVTVGGVDAQERPCLRATVPKALEAHRTGDGPRALREAEIALISGPYVGKVEGTGVMQGVLSLRKIDGRVQPSLRTFGLEHRCTIGIEVETFYAINFSGLSADEQEQMARRYEGRTVHIGGLIKHHLYANRVIDDASLIRALPSTGDNVSGNTVTLQGMIQHQYSLRVWRQDEGSAHEVVLNLAAPLLLDGHYTQSLVLRGADALESGAKLEVTGTLATEQRVDPRGKTESFASLSNLKDLAPATRMNAFYSDPALRADELNDSCLLQDVVVPRQG